MHVLAYLDRLQLNLRRSVSLGGVSVSFAEALPLRCADNLDDAEILICLCEFI